MRIQSPRPGAKKIRELLIVIFLSASLVSPVALAAQSGKRPLAHSDYDAWRSIQLQQLSRDGKFLAYALVPQDGDGEVVARNLATGKEWRHSIGKRPDPTPPEPGQSPAFTPPAGQIAFTADARWLVFTIFPAREEIRKAKKQKKRPEDMPKNSIGIMDIATGEVARVDRVKRFQIPEESAFIAYLMESKTEEKKTDPAPAPEERGRRDNKKKEYGADLVLRNLADKSERIFPDALEFTFSKDAKTLAYAASSKNEDTNGVYAVATSTADAPRALLAGKGKYTRLTWDDKQTQLAFISDRDDAAAKQPRFKLYHWDRQSATAAEIVSASTQGFPQGRVISDKGQLSFSLDGGKLFLGTALPPRAEAEEDLIDDDKVTADLWHWKDDYIQPMQKVRAEQERNRSYRAVVHLKEKKFVQLADETMPEINTTQDGRWGLGADDRAYRRLVGVDTNYADYYLVDTSTGNRKPLREKHQGGLSWSPGGKYALFFDGRDWNAISTSDGKVVNLTKSLGVSFSQEDHDSPSTPPSYGNAGWTADEKYILLYDRYDIWQVAPDGSGAKNLTDGVGRKEKTELRYIRLDSEERSIDPARPMLLKAENEVTRDSGFYRDKVNGGLPEKLIMAAKNFTNPQKAKAADVLLLTASTFSEFPDLLVTGPDFREIKKVSEANPQKEKLLWGAAELVHFRNTDGVPLDGVLIKPENFDPKKKYPMIVYIYERLSDGIHRFTDPRPGHSVNASFYASNGYLVFMPDIVYTVGYPGHSALKCVLPGIQAIVDRGFVDENAIGIQGHSWGGYQIAYMVTQTNRFRAAAPGALVANMTSAYSGIRWGTGLPRQFQYERTQSRIGGNLWEQQMRFLENSPVFRADRVQTPILMLHNDQDDAVPWYQGIEYYLALRRLGKEVYMFNYNGEPHGLRRRANQKDYTIRLQQFFDHFLKGAAKPEWIEKGIPFLEREREKEKQKAAPSPVDQNAKKQ